MMILTEKRSAQLTVVSREGMLRDVLLDKGLITIGRAPQNEIVLDDPAISSAHAVIAIIQGDALLEDLDSTNGTRINGQPVKRHFLQEGDVIELGRTILHYKTFFVPDGGGEASSQEPHERTVTVSSM